MSNKIQIGREFWRNSGGVLTPLARPHIDVTPERQSIREALRESGALLAIWTTNWDLPDATEWWWNCCDMEDYSVDNIASRRGRRSIRVGLRRCEIRRVSAAKFAEDAYPIHAEAVFSYGQSPPKKPDYSAAILGMSKFPGTELWGAYVENRMAAFATCQVFDGAVNLGSTKSDHSLDKHNPNAALFYSIWEHYQNRGIKYVTNGWRSLWHPTNINNFLMTLGFRRVYCRVNVEASPLVRLVDGLRIASWGRYLGLPLLLRHRWSQVVGSRKLMRIEKTFR